MLELLPPLVQARDVKEFFVGSLEVPGFGAGIIREVTEARDDVATRLMVLEERTVKVVVVGCELPIFLFLVPRKIICSPGSPVY